MIRIVFFTALILLFMWPRTFFISLVGTGVSPFTFVAFLMLILSFYLLVISRDVQDTFIVSLKSGASAVGLTLLFWGWRFLSDFFGINSGISLKADALELFYFGSWFFTGIIMFTHQGSPKTLERVLIITVIGSFLVALFEAITGQSFITAVGANDAMAGDAYRANLATTITERDGVARLKSLFSHPIVFGSIIGALAPLAVHKLIHRSEGGIIVATILAICIFQSIILANARTSYVVLAISLASYCVLYIVNLKRFSGIIAGTMILLGSPIYIPAAIVEVNAISSGRNADESRSTQARAMQANMALAAASTRPISGFGTGMAIDVAGIQPQGRSFKTIDNYYLNMVVDYGYIGLASFSMLLICYIIVGVGAIHSANSPSDRSLLCVVVSAIFGLSASFFAVSINDALSWIFLFAGYIVARKGRDRLEIRASFADLARRRGDSQAQAT